MPMTSLTLMTYSPLGNSVPVNQFGLVDNEDNHEYLPFMVCFYQEENHLNAVHTELARKRRSIDTATTRRKSNRVVVEDEE